MTIRHLIAYLDPGTSATLMQMVLAGTAGLAAGGKIIFSRLKRRRKSEGNVPEPATPLAEDPAPSE